MPMRFAHGKEKHFRGKEQITLINPEAAQWAAEKLLDDRKPRYKTVILDELSFWKNHGAKRVEAWLKLQRRIHSQKGFVIGGTGTPVGAHLKDLYGEMLCVDGGESLGTDFDMFKRKHFYEDEYTYQLTPYDGAEAQIMDAIRDRAIAFDINDLAMPELNHLPHYLILPPAVQEAYTRLHRDSAHEELELYAVNAAVKSNKLRQLTGGGVIDIKGERKMLHDAKAEHLQNILDEHDGRPVLVFFEFLSDYQTLCRVLKRDVPALYGRTRQADARKWINQWNRGELPVLACHPRSAGYGLNLQDSGNVIVWYTVPWSYEMVNQGIARLWRQGQKNKVLVYYLLVEGTEDERVFGRVEERAETHERVMKALTR